MPILKLSHHLTFLPEKISFITNVAPDITGRTKSVTDVYTTLPVLAYRNLKIR